MLDKAKNRGILKPYLRNINVRWFECDLSDVLEMKFLEEEYERCTVIKGDILICEGGYPGRAAIWQEDYSIHFQKALHRVRFNNTEYNKFFVYYLYYLERTGLLKSHFTGTGIQHFTGQALHNLPVPMPPLKCVNTIVAQLDCLSIETQRLENIYQQKLAALDELKKSILQKAFSGELAAPHLIQQEMVWA
jgi:type I restriction enzyme S subunit